MDEIRFNNPMRPPVQKEAVNIFPKEPPKIKTKRSFKKLSLVILVILLLAVLFAILKFSGIAGSGTPSINLTHPADPSASNDYAVFLAGGQVYFGEIAENNNSEMVLTGAYRMQPSGQTYSLIKLTDEAYGSTNQIFINRSQILFYEQLRKDSQVVKLIEQQGR